MGPMLLARPSGFASWTYLVSDGDEDLLEVAVPTLFGTPRVRVRGVPFGLETEGITHRLMRLTFQGVAIAASRRSGVLQTTYDVKVSSAIAEEGPEALVLTPSLASRTHTVSFGENRLGEIRAANPFSRKAEVDLPEILPLPVQGLLLAVVLDAWRQDNG